MSIPNSPDQSRREFLAQTAQGLAAAGLTGALAHGADAAPDAPARYHLCQSLTLDARQARSIAVANDGRILIAADNSVRIFSADLVPAGRINLDRPARCAISDENGRLLVGLKDHIQVFDSQGRKLAAWDGLGRHVTLTSIAATSDQVFAADSVSRVIWRFDRAGKLLGRIEREGAAFITPIAFFPIAVSGGRLHVADVGRHTVESYSLDGRKITGFGGRSRDLEGFGGCCNPVSLGAMPDGRLITAEQGRNRVKLFDAGGNFITLLAGPDQLGVDAAAMQATDGTCGAGGIDVAVGPDGAIAVLGRSLSRVTLLKPV